MNIISTKKSREKWARKKAKELKSKSEHIEIGSTHASFLKVKKNGEISGVQIRYPDSVLGSIKKWSILILTILFSSIFGGMIGFLIGALFFEEKVMWILSIIGFVLVAIWKILEEIQFS